MSSCKACIVRCGDPRIDHVIPMLQESLGLSGDQCHLLSIPGGAGNPLLGQHLTSINQLCPPDSIIVTIHENCLAGATLQHLLASHAIARQFAQNVRLFIIHHNGTWEAALA